MKVLPGTPRIMLVAPPHRSALVTDRPDIWKAPEQHIIWSLLDETMTLLVSMMSPIRNGRAPCLLCRSEVTPLAPVTLLALHCCLALCPVLMAQIKCLGTAGRVPSPALLSSPLVRWLVLTPSTGVLTQTLNVRLKGLIDPPLKLVKSAILTLTLICRLGRHAYLNGAIPLGTLVGTVLDVIAWLGLLVLFR